MERGVETVEYRLAPADEVVTCAGSIDAAMPLYERLQVGDVPLTDVRFWYYQNRLVVVWFAFLAKDYPKVREAFLARYGPSTGTEPLADPSGTFVALETFRWTGRRVRIWLALRVGAETGQLASANFTTQAYHRTMEARQGAATRRRVEGLD